MYVVVHDIVHDVKAVFGHRKYSKTCVKRLLSKRLKIGFQYYLLLDAGQKYCRMLQGEVFFAILSTLIKLPFVIKIFVLSILSGYLYRLYCTCCLLNHVLNTCTSDARKTMCLQMQD